MSKKNESYSSNQRAQALYKKGESQGSVNDLGAIPDGKLVNDKGEEQPKMESRAGSLLRRFKALTESKQELRFNPILTSGQAAELTQEIKSAFGAEDIYKVSMEAVQFGDKADVAGIKAHLDKKGYKYDEVTVESMTAGMDVNMQGTPDTVTKDALDPNIVPDLPASQDPTLKDDVVQCLVGGGFMVEPMEGGFKCEKDGKSCIVKWGSDEPVAPQA